MTRSHLYCHAELKIRRTENAHETKSSTNTARLDLQTTTRYFIQKHGTFVGGKRVAAIDVVYVLHSFIHSFIRFTT